MNSRLLRAGVQSCRAALHPRLPKMLRAATLLGAMAVSSSAAAADDATVAVDWSTTLRLSKTQTALQVVVNPLIARDSPVHDAIFASLASLGADHVRYVPVSARRGAGYRVAGTARRNTSGND